MIFYICLALHSVSGHITGFEGAGHLVAVSASLKLNSNIPIKIPESSTSFSFETKVEYNSNYLVTVSTQPLGYTCVVSQGAGTVGGDISDVEIGCSLSKSYSFPYVLIFEKGSILFYSFGLFCRVYVSALIS